MLKGCVERSRCVIFKMNPWDLTVLQILLQTILPNVYSNAFIRPRNGSAGSLVFITAGKVQHKRSFLKGLLAVFLSTKVKLCSLFITFHLPILIWETHKSKKEKKKLYHSHRSILWWNHLSLSSNSQSSSGPNPSFILSFEVLFFVSMTVFTWTWGVFFFVAFMSVGFSLSVQL